MLVGPSIHSDIRNKYFKLNITGLKMPTERKQFSWLFWFIYYSQKLYCTCLELTIIPCAVVGPRAKLFKLFPRIFKKSTSMASVCFLFANRLVSNCALTVTDKRTEARLRGIKQKKMEITTPSLVSVLCF